MLLEALKAFLFGIVEGITEWLPISSTGHMMLLNEFVTLDVSAAFYDTFLVVIQLGAILAVILLYFNKLNPFARSKTDAQKRETWGIWAKVVVGSIPAAIVGFLLDDWMEEHLMNGNYGYVVVACMLIVYGVIFIVMERRNKQLIAIAESRAEYRKAHAPQRAVAQTNDGEEAAPYVPTQHDEARARLEARRAARGQRAAAPRAQEDNQRSHMGEDERDASSAIAKVNTFSEMSFARAFFIGIFEALAIIPGTSRSGSIIIGSMLLGTSRTIATEFAFFLAIPIMFGWSLLKFIKHGFAYTGVEWMIFIIGIVVSFVVSVLAIKFLIGYIKKNDFTPFGIYRIILGVVILAYFAVRSFLF